jgi:hypothetical protein
VAAAQEAGEEPQGDADEQADGRVVEPVDKTV